MFEAIHGSAPRMITEGRGKYADPCSMLRASVMLLSHIGYQDKADALERLLTSACLKRKSLPSQAEIPVAHVRNSVIM